MPSHMPENPWCRWLLIISDSWTPCFASSSAVREGPVNQPLGVSLGNSLSLREWTYLEELPAWLVSVKRIALSETSSKPFPRLLYPDIWNIWGYTLGLSNTSGVVFQAPETEYWR